MAEPPLTRATLLARLRDGTNAEAWREFLHLYGPVVYGFARNRGLQDADAADLMQEVLRSVARNAPRMEYDPAKGPFRGYRPYIGKKAPDVLWFEGTAEMRFVSTFLGQPTEALDASMNSWWDVTRKQNLAPLGADRCQRRSPPRVPPTSAVVSGALKQRFIVSMSSHAR